ncbi:ead/Ea22-like family protein [Escherichia coli]|nr:ead/Ea22-like family protein [Escherichia coli]
MSNIDKRVLREAAVRAGGMKWQYMRATQHSKAYITDDKGSTVINCTDGDVPAKCAGFLESANPAAVLALLDDLEAAEKTSAARLEALDRTHKMYQREKERVEAAEKYAKDRDAENKDLMLTVGRLRVEKEAAEKRIAELEAREVTLPPTFWYDHDDLPREIPVLSRRLVIKALREAGVKIAAAGKGEAS